MLQFASLVTSDIVENLSSVGRDNATQQCMIQHLQSRNLLRDDFPELDENFTCVHSLEQIGDAAMIDFARKLNNKSGGQFNIECLNRELKENHFENEIFKEIVYQNALHWPEKLKEKKLKHIVRIMRKTVMSYATDCLDGSVFFERLFVTGSYFNDISPKDDFERERNKYCVRKFVFESNLLNGTKDGTREGNSTKIVLNPQGINITNIDCDSEILKSRAKLDEGVMNDESLTKIEKDCIINLNKEHKVFENFIWIPVFMEMKPTEGQKKKKRVLKFNHFFPTVYKIRAICSGMKSFDAFFDPLV